MADEIASALEALAADSNRCAPKPASAIRRRGDHRRVAARAAATGVTMTVAAATAGTAVAVAHQTASGGSRLLISGSPSPSPSPSATPGLGPAPVSIPCESNADRHLQRLAASAGARASKEQQKSAVVAARRHLLNAIIAAHHLGRQHRQDKPETDPRVVAGLIGPSAIGPPSPPFRSGRVRCVPDSKVTASPAPTAS